MTCNSYTSFNYYFLGNENDIKEKAIINDFNIDYLELNKLPINYIESNKSMNLNKNIESLYKEINNKSNNYNKYNIFPITIILIIFYIFIFLTFLKIIQYNYPNYYIYILVIILGILLLFSSMWFLYINSSLS